MAQLYIQRLSSPVGVLEITTNESHVLQVQFLDEPATTEENPSELTKQVCVSLAQYFSGEKLTFNLPYGPEGTAFQKQVWDLLLRIKAGETCSYIDIAKQLENPGAVRAVGAANGSNPIAILIPCHRVVGANGKLTGYAGGIERKRWLLAHEREHSPFGQKALF